MSHTQMGKKLKGNLPESKDRATSVAPAEIKDATVLNIICMGTGCHHCNEDSQSVLTALYAAIRASKQLVHITDGFGAEPKTKAEETINLAEALKNPMPGTYKFSCKFDAEKAELEIKKEPLTDQGGVALKVKQLVRGKGYKTMVLEIIQICDALMRAGIVNLIINFYGYSRGADLARRVANILQAEYRLNYVRVNDFAIDAVPGPGRKSAMKARIVSPIIGENFSILMAHEYAPGFEPMDASRLIPLEPAKTVMRYQIYYGRHGTAKAFPKNPNLCDSAKLLWDDIHKFSKRNGTLLKTNVAFVPESKQQYAPMDHDQRFKHYTLMLKNQKGYAEMEMIGSRREFLARKEDYLLHGRDYFSDKEHQELFMRVQQYEAYFDYFFQKNVKHHSVEQVQAAMQAIAADTDLAGTLEAAKYPIHSTTVPFPLPRGIPIVARFEVLTEFAVPMISKFWELFHAMILITNLAHRDKKSKIAKWGNALRREIIDALENPDLVALQKMGIQFTPDAMELYFEKFLIEKLLAAMKTLPAIPAADVFHIRLNGLLGNPVKLKTDFCQFAIAKLSKINFPDNSEPEFKQIRDAFVKQLQEVNPNQTELLRTMLYQCLHFTARVRFVCQIHKEVELDKVLRKLQIVLSPTVQPMSDKDKMILEQFMQTLESIAPVSRLQETRGRSQAGSTMPVVHEANQAAQPAARGRRFAVTQFAPASAADDSSAPTQNTHEKGQKIQDSKKSAS